MADVLHQAAEHLGVQERGRLLSEIAADCMLKITPQVVVVAGTPIHMPIHE
jgi:hypothetical protein